MSDNLSLIFCCCSYSANMKQKVSSSKGLLVMGKLHLPISTCHTITELQLTYIIMITPVVYTSTNKSNNENSNS